MGWTWSLAVQVHFLIIFPILIKIFGRGKGLFRLLIAVAILQIFFRYFLYKHVALGFAPPKIYLFEYADKDMFFIFFNVWYSSTPQRMIGCFFGVLLAYVNIHHKDTLIKYIGNTVIHTLLTVACVRLLYLYVQCILLCRLILFPLDLLCTLSVSSELTNLCFAFYLRLHLFKYFPVYCPSP